MAMKKVALMFSVARMHEVQTLRGVVEYASKRGKWLLDANPDMFPMSLEALADWSGHGALAPLTTHRQIQVAKSLGVPVVNLAGVIRRGGLPRVMADQEMIGRLAAEHFLDRGYRRFAYFGEQRIWYSHLRKQGFITRIQRSGGECSVLDGPHVFSTRQPWHHWKKKLQEWLATLKLPVAVLAVHDYRAHMVVDACFELKLRIPRDVALVGVGDDLIACEFSRIPLSSVARNGRLEGYEAAALLDRLMAGKKPPKHDILIPPAGVVSRKSTDAAAIENPHVAAAVRFICENLDKTFGVEALEEQLEVSRRYLYYHFRQCLNCTPYEYINRARVALAKKLLTDPEKKLQLKNVARSCGFSDTRRLRLVFQQMTGATPAEYRNEHGSVPS